MKKFLKGIIVKKKIKDRARVKNVKSKGKTSIAMTISDLKDKTLTF
jgi:hypothetical protein